MIGAYEQRIYRELCKNLDKKFSQRELSNICDCSVSYVNKVVKKLKKKNFIHNPFKNRIALLDFQGLLLYWAFTRDLEDEKIIRIKTDHSVEELEKVVKRTFKDYAPALFTAAKEFGVKYVVHEVVSVYIGEKELEKLDKIKKGNKTELFVIVCNNHNGISTPAQIFVDLVSLNTWESKITAFKLSEKFDNFPVFGTRVGLKEIL